MSTNVIPFFQRKPIQPIAELIQHVPMAGPRYVVAYFDPTGIVQQAYGTPTGRLFRSIDEAGRFSKTVTRRTEGFAVVLEMQEYSNRKWAAIRND